MSISEHLKPEESLSAVSKLARAELEKYAKRDEALTMFISQNQEQHELMLPAEAVDLLLQILENLALQRSVSVVASDKQLSTQEVANILRVSRPHVTKLIDNGELACVKVGTHRRIRYDDLVRFKNKIDNDRRETLNELAKQAQELGLGY